jgi:bacteriocin biosynthesis cyclodehydratase domain-containing protein
VAVARNDPAPPLGDLSAVRVAVVGSGAVGRALVHALRVAGAPVEQFASVGSWLGAFDICVAAEDAPAAGPLLELNRWCLGARVPLLPGLAMGEVGQAGPIVRGGAGPCLRCVDLRLRSVTGRSCLVPYGPPDPRTTQLLAAALASGVAALEDPDATHFLTYHWPDGRVTRHPILRSWRCPDCARIDPQPAYRRRTMIDLRDRRPSDPARILSLRERLVDPVTGPITSLELFGPAPYDPQVLHSVATLVDEGWQRAGHAVLQCGGGALDPREAEAAALGEALERASAVLPPAGDFLVAPYRKVKTQAVDPRAWDLFAPQTRSEAGFPYPRVSRSDPISWTWGWSLTRREPTLVPAARVFVPFESSLAGDAPDYPLLSGFAAGGTLEEAALHALLEVIERDSFMIAWANRLALRRVRFDADDRAGARTYAALFELPGLEARCGLVELDLGAPVAIAMVRSSRPGDPALVVAAAADPDPARACRRALAELTANRLNVRHSLAESGGRTPPPDPDLVRDETAHGLLYASTGMLGEVRHWWDPPETVALPDVAQPMPAFARLMLLVEAIERAGLEVLLVDLTAPEIRQLGVSTVKVLVPGAYPMNFDSRWPHLGGARLTRAPVDAGLRDRPLDFAELNRTPHPFP